MAQAANELRLKQLQEVREEISKCVTATQEIIRTMYNPGSNSIASDDPIHKTFTDSVLPYLRNAIQLTITYSPDSKELTGKENDLVKIAAALFLTGLCTIKIKCYQVKHSGITMVQFSSSKDPQEKKLLTPDEEEKEKQKKEFKEKEKQFPTQAFTLFKVLFDVNFKQFLASSSDENLAAIREAFQAALKLAESMHKLYADKKGDWDNTMIGRQFHTFDEKLPASSSEQKTVQPDASSSHLKL